VCGFCAGLPAAGRSSCFTADMADLTDSIWRATHPRRAFGPFSHDLHADVAVVGGGITGLTAAVLLARAGRRVVLVERDRVGSGETGNTTGHLTEAIDGGYAPLIKAFGEEGARLVSASSRDAIAFIETIAARARTGCDFERVIGYLFAEATGDVERLANELDAARRAGCHVAWTDDVPLPFATAGGIAWEDQAQVHATLYVDALLQEALTRGVRVHDRTRAIAVRDGEPCHVETDHGDIRAADVVVAANVPINNRVWLHTKIAAYRSYAIAFPTDLPLDGLYWDTARPYHYLRSLRVGGRSYAIVGGEDHRTGEETDTGTHYDALADYATARMGPVGVAFRWSGQIIEPVDGLPFIGLNTASHHVHVATGFSGNGLTFGTLAGMILSDLILGRPNAYAELYAATRVKPMASARDYVTENVAFPARLLKDRLTSLNTEERAPASLMPGEGIIVSGPDGKVAVCRDLHGALHACSAVCTHLACDVAWNQSEGTWDCPCHGSRFSPEGKVLNGPAVIDLEWRRIPGREVRG